MGIELETNEPSIYKRIPRHECNTPGGWAWYGADRVRICEFGIGSIFKCDECGKEWISSKAHCLDWTWRAVWRRKRWFRPLPWPFP